MRACGVIIGLALLAANQATAQGGAESKAALTSESRKEKGSAEILKKLLAEHAEARHKKTKESIARAEEIDRKLPEYDWSALDVASATFEFALDQEQKAHDRKIDYWDFDRMPPSLVGIPTPERWAGAVEKRLDAVIDHAGSVSWKSPKARRNATNEMLRSRAFEKVASHLATHLAAGVASIPRSDLTRMWDAFFRIYEDYDIETVHRCTQYNHLPAGYYLQWAGWLGDRRAWRKATTMVDAWLDTPRDSREPNLVQAVRTIDLFNTRLDLAREPERAELIRRIKADARIPQAVKTHIRTVP